MGVRSGMMHRKCCEGGGGREKMLCKYILGTDDTKIQMKSNEQHPFLEHQVVVFGDLVAALHIY